MLHLAITLVGSALAIACAIGGFSIFTVDAFPFYAQLIIGALLFGITLALLEWIADAWRYR